METNKIQLATISILVKDRAAKAPEVNEVLSKHGNIIMARLGLHLEESGPENMAALITVVVKASEEQISSLTQEIDKVYGVVAKASIFSE